jgi:epoxyqueuosine reductase
VQSSKSKNSQLIKQKAYELGFQFCGISKADFLDEEAPRLENWLTQNRNGEMNWMENHFDKRLDPRKLVEGSKSVISFMLNYFPEEELLLEKYKISRYAYGIDYHFVIKDKLKELFAFISQEIGEINGRIFTDSAPVMDKAWAKKSGLGWMGKNTNLIHPKSGSYFFLAEIICDLELEYDGPIKDYCGTCTKCLDACPTDALFAPYQLDGSKCISYLTIELKDKIPDEFKGSMSNWVFGCDICQEVCPWNRFSKPSTLVEFEPNSTLKNITDSEMKEITKEVFSDLFKKSAIKRTKFEGLKRNISFLNNE